MSSEMRCQRFYRYNIPTVETHMILDIIKTFGAEARETGSRAIGGFRL